MFDLLEHPRTGVRPRGVASLQLLHLAENVALEVISLGLEHGTENLFSAELLGRSELQAARAVNAEVHPVLCGLAERDRRRFESRIELVNACLPDNLAFELA